MYFRAEEPTSLPKEGDFTDFTQAFTSAPSDVFADFTSAFNNNVTSSGKLKFIHSF